MTTSQPAEMLAHPAAPPAENRPATPLEARTLGQASITKLQSDLTELASRRPLPAPANGTLRDRTRAEQDRIDLVRSTRLVREELQRRGVLVPRT